MWATTICRRLLGPSISSWRPRGGSMVRTRHSAPGLGQSTTLTEEVAAEKPQRAELARLAMAGLEAMRVADAFFAMCRTVGDLKDDDLSLEKPCVSATSTRQSHDAMRSPMATGGFSSGGRPRPRTRRLRRMSRLASKAARRSSACRHARRTRAITSSTRISRHRTLKPRRSGSRGWSV
jgi:hypothetical protein